MTWKEDYTTIGNADFYFPAIIIEVLSDAVLGSLLRLGGGFEEWHILMITTLASVFVFALVMFLWKPDYMWTYTPEGKKVKLDTAKFWGSVLIYFGITITAKLTIFWISQLIEAGTRRKRARRHEARRKRLLTFV